MDNIKSRYWHIIVHIQCMKNAGLTDEQIKDPQYVVDYYREIWNRSGKNRICCITACRSAEGIFHVHGVLCGDQTTLSAVRKTMYNAHVEKCIGGKRVLLDYIRKKGKHEEKGEIILAESCDNGMEPKQGCRNDLKHYQKMLDDGYTPEEVFFEDIGSIKYDKSINKWYAIRKSNEAPNHGVVYVEWHIGDTGTGKSRYYEELCREYGENDIFLIGDLRTGWIDDYVEKGCPKILFLDDFDQPCDIQDLLSVIDTNPRKSIHGRYKNTYPLWEKVYIASLEPPEVIFNAITHKSSYKKLLRKVDYFVFHYIDDHRLCRYMLPSEQYNGYEDIKHKARLGVEYVKRREVLVSGVDLDDDESIEVVEDDQLLADVQGRGL